MDIPSWVTPESFSARPRSARHYRLLWIALICGALASLVSAYLIYHTSRQSSETFAVSFGNTVASSLYAVQGSTFVATTSTQVLFPNEKGTMLPVIDVVRVGDGMRYYILAESDEPFVSNVFSETSSGSVTRLTNSKNLKYNLSFDPVLGILAYQATDGTSALALLGTEPSDIVTLSLTSHTEQLLGTGSNPVLIQGTGTLLFSTGGELKRGLISTKQISPSLLTIGAGASYVVMPTSGKIVLYNGTTKSLDYYQLSRTGTATYISSTHVAAPVTFMDSIDDTLVTGTTETGPDHRTSFTLRREDTGRSISITALSPRARIHNAVVF